MSDPQGLIKLYIKRGKTLFNVKAPIWFTLECKLNVEASCTIVNKTICNFSSVQSNFICIASITRQIV